MTAARPQRRLRISRGSLWLVAAWLVFVGGTAALALAATARLVPELAPGSATLKALGNLMQCLVPLFANAGLLVNAASPRRRWNIFWTLMALGCTTWLGGKLLWTYVEVGQQQSPSLPFRGDVIFFLQTVPMLGAVAVQPHVRRVGTALRYGFFDLLLLGLWWVYLYLFCALPWKLVGDFERYARRYAETFAAENVVLLGLLGVFCLRTTGTWRRLYAHLLGASSLYFIASQATHWGLARGTYYTGSWYDVPLVASFAWFGTAGILAHRGHRVPPPAEEGEEAAGLWPARIAMACILSMPLLALWSVLASEAPAAVKQFRLVLTLCGIVGGSTLVFLRQHLVDRERLRLLKASQDAIENVRRLQAQFVQSEKLASLGRLAAGAAHEINNPLTAILGYTDLLLDDPGLGERPRSLLGKLREQARRTKTLVTNLLSFARQVPAEKSVLDINRIVGSAVQLRTLDLRDRHIRVDLQAEPSLPGVRGDPNQLLQVFFNIVSNAVDAMEESGGGLLTVRTTHERADVVIEFSDTGLGMRDPQLVFDPFYTTKPVGKGTGLGLSICYGIIQEHGGQITCRNLPGGGATFRIELPSVAAFFPPSPAAQPVGKS